VNVYLAGLAEPVRLTLSTGKSRGSPPPTVRPGYHCLYVQPDSPLLEPQSSPIFATDTIAPTLALARTLPKNLDHV